MGMEIDWFSFGLGFLGGLAMFLFGMAMLVNAMMALTGKELRYFLARLTTNRFTGALAGAISTAIIQSSSITSVLVVGFVSAGLMNLYQAAGVIMGANVGTTITAQLIAFRMDDLALGIMALGVGFYFLSKTQRKKNIGELLFSLGLLFYGMHLMSDALSPLRHYSPFLAWMHHIENPFYGVLVGMAFTALIQSSSATTGVVIALASNGLVSLEGGIALILGANVGTTVTAVLAALGAQNRDALRAAWIHMAFNLFGVMIWVFFISQLAALSQWVTSLFAEQPEALTHLPREIANAHTLFNVINLVIFLPLIPLLVKTAYWWVPMAEKEQQQHAIRPRFLDDHLLKTPALAFEALFQELDAFREQLGRFLHRLHGQIEHPSIDQLTKLAFIHRQFVSYQEALALYLGKINQTTLSEQEKAQFLNLTRMLSLLENILDSIEADYMQVLRKMIEADLEPSQKVKDWLKALADTVEKSLDSAMCAVIKQNETLAMEVFALKKKVDYLMETVIAYQAEHLQATEKRVMIFRLEIQLINYFKRLHTPSKRLARLVQAQTP